MNNTVRTYITEGERIYVTTGRTAQQAVLEDAGAPDWVGLLANRIGNMTQGWRPSDAAREAVRMWKNGYTEAQFNAERPR